MRKVVNNDVSKDSTIMTRILSDGGDRIWEIRDMETAGFLKKEAVRASFSLRRIYFTPTENAEHLWNEASNSV